MGVRVAEEQRVRLGWGDCAENPASRVSVHRTIPPAVSGYKSGDVEHAARRFRGLSENRCLPTWQHRRGWRSDAGQPVDFPVIFSVAVLDLSAYVSILRVSLVRAGIHVKAATNQS